MTAHTLDVISLVSQLTSTLVLATLAWVDRRSRWLIPLALACALHAGAVYLRPLWRDFGLWLPLAVSQASLIAMFHLIHLGLQSLARTQHRRSVRNHALILASMLLVFFLARFGLLLCVEVAVAITICVLARTIHMLWTTQAPFLRGPLRATALLLLAIALLFLVRMPLEPLVPAPPLLSVLRRSTMLLITLLAFSFLALYAAEGRRRLHEESRLDVLTGLPNRRAMEEAAAHQILLAGRLNQPCVLLMLDLDNFKGLNDTWGHILGDRCLRAAGTVLLRAAQNVDACTVARMGGEEFAMLLPKWTVTAAYVLSEQLRDAIAALRLAEGEQEVRFTASIGISMLQSGETDWEKMLRRADIALYRAKRDGRNRVALCAEAVRDALDGDTALNASLRLG